MARTTRRARDVAAQFQLDNIQLKNAGPAPS